MTQEKATAPSPGTPTSTTSRPSKYPAVPPPATVELAEWRIADALLDLEEAVAQHRALLDAGGPSELDILEAQLDIEAAHVALGRARLRLLREEAFAALPEEGE